MSTPRSPATSCAPRAVRTFFVSFVPSAAKPPEALMISTMPPTARQRMMMAILKLSEAVSRSTPHSASKTETSRTKKPPEPPILSKMTSPETSPVKSENRTSFVTKASATVSTAGSRERRPSVLPVATACARAAPSLVETWAAFASEAICSASPFKNRKHSPAKRSAAARKRRNRTVSLFFIRLPLSRENDL